MRLLSFQNFIVVLAIVTLASCGGDTSSTTTSTDAGGGTDSGTAATTVTSTSTLYVGKSGGEPSYHIGNTALSVLDVNGDPITNLDGGDFQIIAPKSDFETFHHVQKMDFLTQVYPHIVLMLDISNNMSSRFDELKQAAVKLVNDAVALQIPVTVYAFSTAGSVDPLFPVGGTDAVDAGTAATVTGAINALTQQLGNTFFYESIATIVGDRVGGNVTIYDHTNTATPPVSSVELMVIMSDGLDSSTANSSSDVTSLSDGAYWILSIAVGDNPDVAALEAITTEFPVITTAADGGTYDQAVTDAMTFIENYYNGFYLVEYQIADTTNTSLSYDIKLFDNDGSAVTVGPLDVTLLPSAWLAPVCCDIWAGAGFGVNASAVTINATLGNTMDFQVVQRWSNLLNTSTNVTWTLSGNLTGQQDPDDPTRYTITTTGNTGSASLTVNVGSPAWSTVIPITMN